MSNSPADRLDRLAAESNVATLDAPAPQSADKRSGPCCEKCGAPFKSDLVSVCNRCGWYASLNQYIEVDKDYEAFQNDDCTAERAQTSHAKVWMSLLPPWSWILIATVLVIVAESVYALFFTDGEVRMVWSVIQLFIGLAAFIGCHLFNFLVAATEDTDVGFLDVVVKPLGLWLRALRNLPRRLWVADGALGGATAVLMSVLVIGSLPYEMLFEGTGKKKSNILASMVKQAQKLPAGGNGGNLSEMVNGASSGGGGGADNLEDAVGDFAGRDLNFEEGNGAAPGNSSDVPSSSDGAVAGADAGDEADEKKPKQAKYEKVGGVRPKLACVILGYRLDAQGRISDLVLGATHDDKLAYAGIVATPADDASLIDLVDDLERSQIPQPYLPLYVQANWVLPKFVCQVNYDERESDGRLIDIQWEKLRGTLAQPVYRPPSMSAARQ
jgi:hypothetical protein